MKRLKEGGFTLIEIAIAIVVIALLLGSLLGPLSVRIEQADRKKTQELLDEIKEALYGYAATTSTLPCPDTDGDGAPNGAPPTTPCTDIEGRLPWQTLGVERADAWGYHFRYRVTPEFTAPNIATCDDNAVGTPTDWDGNFDLCDVGDITVSTRDNNKALVPLVTNAPAVILSHGKNGLGATRIDGGAMPPTAGGTDEDVNADPTETNFMTRTYSFPSTNCDDDTDPALAYCEFDDLVAWLSPNILKNRMIAAGRLP
ncbi:MAG: prepilin-type N-terminal cleavage/methylation domain-containing protein [Gammaproteobacteria bacterium]